MDIEKLRTFVAASHCSTFSEAADQLFITPATVSKHIAALELEFGTALFQRGSGKLEHTEAGRLCLRAAEKITAEYDSLYQKISAPNVEGIRIASIFDDTDILSQVIHEFLKRRPDTKFELVKCHGNEVVRKVLSGECRFGFAGARYSDFPELERCIFDKQRIVAALSVHHPLADRKQVSLLELRDEPFYLLPPESGAYQASIAMCQEHGFCPNIKRTCSREELLLENVRESGVALIREHAIQRYSLSDVCVVSLTEVYYASAALIRLREASLPPEAKQFWNFFVRFMAHWDQK